MTIITLISKCRGWFRGISITKKLVIGYICIIFLPVLLVGYYLFSQLYQDLLRQYASERQQVFEQAVNQLIVELTQIESSYDLLQNNPTLIHYLNGVYKFEGEMIYHFLKDIRPSFKYINSGNPMIDEIVVYKINDHIQAVAPEFYPIDVLAHSHLGIESLQIGEGRWTYGIGEYPQLNFYKKIYDQTYLTELGILEVKVDTGLMESLFQTISTNESDRLFLLNDQFEVVYNKSDNLAKIEEWTPLQSIDENQLMWNSVYIEKLQLHLVKASEINGLFVNFEGKRDVLVGLVLLSLFVLSILYYILARSISKRILKLADHMGNLEENEFKSFIDENNNDEIGILASAYNEMMLRIDELINKVQREELTRKEAEYLALQSQINPHFIYNTVETIRMMAEVNDDHEVAHVSYMFGRLMRYSLSPKKIEATIGEEVDHIRNYLSIHQYRMGDRLTYEIDCNSQFEKYTCPRFLLQPLVENSIIHGLSNSRTKGYIIVRIKKNEDILILEIIDNGIGMSSAKLKEVTEKMKMPSKGSHNGIGLSNIMERIKLFYGNSAEFSITSNVGKGTTCRLILPKRREAGEDLSS